MRIECYGINGLSQDKIVIHKYEQKYFRKCVHVELTKLSLSSVQCLRRNSLRQEETPQNKEHLYHGTPAASGLSARPGTQG